MNLLQHTKINLSPISDDEDGKDERESDEETIDHGDVDDGCHVYTRSTPRWQASSLHDHHLHLHHSLWYAFS
jgi:hypothetical protein